MIRLGNKATESLRNYKSIPTNQAYDESENIKVPTCKTEVRSLAQAKGFLL
jgi:hypothetical protein